MPSIWRHTNKYRNECSAIPSWWVVACEISSSAREQPVADIWLQTGEKEIARERERESAQILSQEENNIFSCYQHLFRLRSCIFVYVCAFSDSKRIILCSIKRRDNEKVPFSMLCPLYVCIEELGMGGMCMQRHDIVCANVEDMEREGDATGTRIRPTGSTHKK